MLYKRGKIYWTRFSSQHGRKIRKSLKTENYKEAKRKEAEVIASCVNNIEPSQMSWGDATDRWIKEAQEHGKSTIPNDLCTLRWLESYLGGLRLSEITSDMIKRLRDEKLSTGATNATVNRMLALVRSILRKARDEWECGIQVPPIKLLREQTRRLRWLTRDQAESLLNELPEHIEAAARFTLATGLRESNVRLLRWEQIDLTTKTAWFSESEMKSGRALGVPLNSDAMDVLKSQSGMNPVYVFTLNGSPVQQFNTPAWRKALQRAGISKYKDVTGKSFLFDDFRWHDLRHTWASWHVQHGTRIEVLKELGGWSSLSMVLRYAHLNSSVLANDAGRIAGGAQ